jgi:C-methyltransferase
MSDEQSRTEFFRRVFGSSWITQGLWVAAELGIADLLAERARTVEELAGKTGAHAGALYRVLRALAGIGVFA